MDGGCADCVVRVVEVAGDAGGGGEVGLARLTVFGEGVGYHCGWVVCWCGVCGCGVVWC